MKMELFQQVIESEQSLRRDGKGIYLVGEEIELTVILEVGHEALQVGRVKKISLGGEVLTLETHKGERYYFGPDTPVRGLRINESEGHKLRSAGFAK